MFAKLQTIAKFDFICRALGEFGFRFARVLELLYCDLETSLWPLDLHLNTVNYASFTCVAMNMIEGENLCARVYI